MDSPNPPDIQIWIDGDACPNPVKEIVFRAADKRQLPTILVANQLIRTPKSAYIRAIQVPAGYDVADNHIVNSVVPGDLVITADIPLASLVIGKQAHALNPRGELYTQDNISQRLTLRDFMEEMRSAGQISGGPPPFGQKDRQAFANALDRFLSSSLPK